MGEIMKGIDFKQKLEREYKARKMAENELLQKNILDPRLENCQDYDKIKQYDEILETAYVRCLQSICNKQADKNISDSKNFKQSWADKAYG